jgi:hypothetical protein
MNHFDWAFTTPKEQQKMKWFGSFAKQKFLFYNVKFPLSPIYM